MEGRVNEWFVPKFGPLRFRAFVGMLFLPYTGMCISFTLLGSILVDVVHWDRVIALSLIYFLALGIGAHALDAIGSKRKPWGNVLGFRLLLVLAVSSIAVAYAIGVYYIIYYVPLLSIIAILEGFFLLAYNLELFRGLFHNNLTFSISWGSLPLLAGYMMQTNGISIEALLLSIVTAAIAYAEIRVSRLYKEMKRANNDRLSVVKYEIILKSLSISTIAVALILVGLRWYL
jgi:hypothetical protein